MARKKSEKPDQFAEALDAAVIVEEAVPVASEEEVVAAPAVPCPTDPEWQTYVMSHFAPSDFDPDGHPYAEACRTVAEKLLGPIVGEVPRTVQAPDASNDYRATVEVVVSIMWDGNPTDIRSFGDVAEMYGSRDADSPYAQHAAASAKTKAMGRAFRAALKLRKVYTSEELVATTEGVALADAEGIAMSQQRFIDTLCRDLDIEVMKFINSGELKYDDISKVRRGRASGMIEVLNNYQQNKGGIPGVLKGYNAEWRKKS